MKIESTEEEFEILFNFDLSIEKDIEQTEFLYVYYIARLKLLRQNNPEPFTTRELSDEEIFYKDIIAAAACYMQSLKLKKEKNERNNKEG